jgi:hypothetical protein
MVQGIVIMLFCPPSTTHLFQRNAQSFSTPARMARDFFAIPATGVLEVVPHLHISMVISEALLLKVWIGEGLLEVNEPKLPQKNHGSAQ